ncbi:hypothetical protein N7519_006109 [Penicillium mononematosum]|uniref:uncharacterized protein n=1 Tax=Penicillium mononematosum TaxID=268346 RepID=UPI002547847D|nr:uncharacterized protein N7519_006109 [Penicillium mononematosum]KAJ6184808.1 hypothetical protein N7519_006109 [Penicillium mononematosum]
MGAQDERSTQKAPEYQETEAPPNYEEALQSCPTTSSRYGSLPSTVSLHGQWTKLKSMNLCAGEDAKNRLCLIEMQTGYSGKPPLGMRTGILLRNGMSSKDSLLAAAGDEARGLHAFNPDGIVFLPPLDPDPKSDRMDTELLRAEPGPNKGIAFHFSIEVGEKNLRQEFAWRKVKKGEDQAKRNGFKLVRLSSTQQPPQPSGSSSVQNASSSSPPSAGKDGETVAFLGWAWPSLTHAFTLEVVDGQSSALGERWTLMIVVTAVRLYTLHVKGKTSKFVVDMGKKT